MEYLKRFQTLYPGLCQEMRDCFHQYSPEHQNGFHLENDVFTHTMMVYNEALKTGIGGPIEMLALLHDIGKIEARQPVDETKRVRFFGHESLSAFKAVDMFSQLRPTFLDYEKQFMFEAICLHTEPFKNEQLLTQKLVNNETLGRYLEIFASCDSAGRFCEMPKQHEFCAKDIKRKPKTPIKEKEVTFLIGLPGSGKSTLVKNQYKNHFVVSRDNILKETYPELTYNEAFQMDQSNTNMLLDKRFRESTKHNKVVVDLTNLVNKKRNSRLNTFYKDYYKTAIVLLPGDKVETERRAMRKDKTIPDYVILNMKKSFSPPLFDSFDKIQYRWE